MKNYVISLAHSTERRKHIIEEFSRHDINFRFFDAITPSNMGDYIHILPLLEKSLNLSEFEKSCFLSHIYLWQECIDENLDYIAIFEDDVYLGENAHLFFGNAQWLFNKHIDFLKTETCLQYRKLSKNSIYLSDCRYAYQLNEFHLGTGGYVLSHQGAKSLLTYVKSLSKETLKPIDNIIFADYLYSQNLPIYQLQPAIVIQACILYPNQNQLPSVIQTTRQERNKNKPKRPLSAKIQGELSNACRKTFGRFIRKKIQYR